MSGAHAEVDADGAIARGIAAEISGPSGHGASEQVLVLEAGRAQRNYWHDVWRYRELFALLAWRDLTIRYKQTAIGVAWGLIRPLATVAVFTIVFSRVAKLPSDGSAPYALMVFAGMLPWTILSNILGTASGCVSGSANLIGKIYFPRVILPAAAVVVVLVDAAISLILLALVMFWFAIFPDWRVLTLPGFIVLAVLAGFGPALWLAAVNVKYRDFQYIVGFVLQFGLYISPVGFSSSAIPQQWRLLYSLNPAVGVIDGFRWSLLRGQTPLYMPGLILSIAITFIVLWSGFAYFRRAENTFSDVI